jgi:hypothetical protein
MTNQSDNIIIKSFINEYMYMNSIFIMGRPLLDQRAQLDLYSVSPLKQQSAWIHLPDSESTSLCSHSLILRA